MEKLLYTGGTGFLGFNTKPILDQMYEVTTIGITDRDVIKANFAKEVPQLSCRYDINYQGTVNLCKALENVGVPKSFIFISTCGVYGIDNGNYVTEDYPLAGEEPYQKSKIMAEEFLTKWCEEHSVILGILRPSLMAGKNAPGNLGAMVNGIKTGKYLSINHGKARKSLLMAEDIAYLVPLVAEKGGVYNVCDDDQPSFGELEELIATQLGKRKPFSIPYWMAKCLALVGDIFSFFPINSSRLEKIVNSDTISNEKAKRELGWKPMSVLENYKI